MATGTNHTWKFFRAGGLDQVLIRDGQDLAHLDQLDQKLWVALSCPTRGIEFDTRTLDLIDTDKDGRIRAPELLAALRWTTQLLKNPDDLTKGSDALPLGAINSQTEAGAKLLTGAKRIITSLGKADAATITLTDIADTAKIFSETKFNGDGIVPAESAPDAATQQAIADIIGCVGAETDRNGKPGISAARLETFLKEAQAFADWWSTAEADKAILPLGNTTGAAYDAVKAVRAKVDDYFVRCSVAAFDARAASPMNRQEDDFKAIAPKELSLASEDIARLPLSHIEPRRALPLSDGVNPAWAAMLDTFCAAVVAPLLGANQTALTHAEWNGLLAKFAPYEVWLVKKAGAPVEKLGLTRVRALLAAKTPETVARLIQEDAALEPEYAQITTIEKLIRYHRDLNRLAHNFVNFADFYHPKLPSMFQIGRLHMDGRTVDLCVHVEDIGKHSTLAGASKTYLAYCEITRPATAQKQNICAVFTNGFAESLWVGRNGIFYDRQGNDWDAVIVKVIESPISLKEAFWSPWKKLAAMISEQIRKLLAAKDAAALAATSKGIDATGKTVEAGKAPLPTKPDGAALASSVAAIGIAVGLLGSAVAGLVTMISGLPLWKTLLGVAIVLLAVSGPSVILAYFKLRARDLAPILNACGWAVNSRIRMTLSLGRVLTQEAKLPVGAERQIGDPYADKNGGRNFLIVLLIVLAALFALWKFDFLNPWLPEQLKHIDSALPPGEPALSK